MQYELSKWCTFSLDPCSPRKKPQMLAILSNSRTSAWVRNPPRFLFLHVTEKQWCCVPGERCQKAQSCLLLDRLSLKSATQLVEIDRPVQSSIEHREKSLQSAGFKPITSTGFHHAFEKYILPLSKTKSFLWIPRLAGWRWETKEIKFSSLNNNEKLQTSVQKQLASTKKNRFDLTYPSPETENRRKISKHCPSCN